ncbi:hypothetical protein CL632_03725 [bacterium]|nr:hypothetical protein [bacterium]|tara:strand:- start:550 stop:1284 length:735 start_codon:yes stop_codon:yes gene_type:complete
MKLIVFWIGLVGVLVSWEMLLLQPARILYWLIICLAASSILSLYVSREQDKWQNSLIDRLALVLFSIGVFWWILWLDFAIIKFAIVIGIWGVLAYVLEKAKRIGIVPNKMRLTLFFGGTFFWSTISYGLLIVIGWHLWQALIIFAISFGLFSWFGLQVYEKSIYDKLRAWLLLFLLGVEFFSVIAWLPFTEVTLALVLTVNLLFSYDLIKYYLFPEFVRKKIIIKKILVYVFFLSLVLISTPWV